MSKIYLIPGIGCSEVIFEKITPLDGFYFQYLTWKEPLKNESFEDYSLRMAEGVVFHQCDVILGVSLGGMVAQVLASKYPQVRCVAVSSCVSSDEYSPFLLAVKRFSLEKVIPTGFFTNPYVASYMITGSIKKRHAEAIKSIFCGMSKHYFECATTWAVNFSSPIKDAKTILRIQGSKDALFPIKTLTTDAVVIEGATHLAVYTHGRKVSEELKKLLA